MGQGRIVCPLCYGTGELGVFTRKCHRCDGTGTIEEQLPWEDSGTACKVRTTTPDSVTATTDTGTYFVVD